ncbi:hypothetical protein [Qipengyuania sp. ASV99]|uniref:hypothetical protein n=1 Tax=Qipengyuania sp. ASV99 TaxID=3399681 RepID=UPI003A4C7305
MAGFGFGSARGRRARSSGNSNGPGVGPGTGPTLSQTIGALTRNQFGGGVPVGASAITSGDAGGHWTISAGRLFPSAAGDAADLNAGPYVLALDDGSTINIVVEPNTWDVTDQSEWDFIARQSPATLAGKKIGLRNTSTLALGITGGFGTPFRRVDLRDGGGSPLVIEGRFGAAGAFADYCEIDRVQFMRGARGITFRHLKTDATANAKFTLVGEGANHTEDITIDDCWVRGETGDPNGDYSTSSNYPNLNRDLINTTGSALGSVGNITVTNCKVEWGDSLVNIRVDKLGAQSIITGNECAYFYGDAIAVTMAPANPLPVTISDNFIHDTVGLATDSANPHVDAIRLQGSTTALADWAGITIERNIIVQGTARGDMQAIFLDDMRTGAGDSGHFFTAAIRNNIVAIDFSVHGITVIQAKDCVVESNTVISWDQGSSNAPSILVAGSGLTTATSGGGNVIRNCIADNIGDSVGTLTLTSNFTTGLNGASIAYSTLFDGPTFAPTTEAEAKAFFNPKVAAGALIP